MKKIIVFFSFALVLMIAACNIDDIDKLDNIDRLFSPDSGNNLGLSGLNSGNFSYEGSDELKKFSSKQELIDFLKAGQSYNSYDSMYYGGMRTLSESQAVPTMADASISKSEESSNSGGSGASAADYSTTNIQVEGVDEADFVKNDGKYIYMISGSSLVIVDAYPADKADIVSETELEGYPRELFINGDRLVVFTENNEEVYGFLQYDIVPRPIYKQKTHAYIYDISDREEPKLLKDFDVKGNYQTSRMIGDYVYTIVQDNVYYYSGYLDTPVIRESAKTIVSPDIYYFDVQDSSYNFNTVMSFNLKNEDEKPKAETYMMGYSSVIYVSENNIYISYQKSMPYSYYDRYNEQRFYDVVVPLLPEIVRDGVKSIQKDDSISAYERWDKISGLLEEMYNKMDEVEKDDYIEKIQDAITQYEVQRKKMRKTVIHKIKIKDGTLDYIARGEVKGYLLNQFSMDENHDELRVATTFETWANDKNVLYNNVYVLDSDMELKGSLEKIAPDERIYSARFMGDRLYMVTFQRMDPFFVIDLSHDDPKVLGKLKIPGFSDYLHPYDETHIIGLGKETEENEWGGISTKGLKLALFDVSDVENPEMIDKYDIGEAGTDSEALNEHKAFLFDKEKNLLVIPVRVVRGTQTYDSRYGYYRQKIWQGAYAFTVTEDGFKLKGKVTHGEEDEYSYWYYGSPNAIKRSLFMDDVLYTISMKKIMMNNLEDMEEIDTIKLPYTENNYPYPYYMKGGMMVE